MRDQIDFEILKMEEFEVKLFSFSTKEKTGIGVETEEGIFNFTEAFDTYQHAKGVRQPVSLNFLQLFVEMGYCSGSTIKKVLSEPWVHSREERLQLKSEFYYNPPIERPSKIIGLGRNYRAHAKELKHEIPKEPIFFAKSPSAITSHEADIVIPHWLEDRVDHEAELALIIGKKAKNISEEEAMSYIAGYTILNDVTARAMQKNDIGHSNPWFRSKSLDTFCPVGPFLIPADEVADPHALEISLTVNGKEHQRASTSEMIFKIPEIVSYISRFMTLSPGDIISTGTPQGVSPIKHGDVIEITITGFGTLKNRVVKEQRA